jgi:hypothetical protein
MDRHDLAARLTDMLDFHHRNSAGGEIKIAGSVRQNMR